MKFEMIVTCLMIRVPWYLFIIPHVTISITFFFLSNAMGNLSLLTFWCLSLKGHNAWLYLMCWLVGRTLSMIKLCCIQISWGLGLLCMLCHACKLYPRMTIYGCIWRSSETLNYLLWSQGMNISWPNPWNLSCSHALFHEKPIFRY